MKKTRVIPLVIAFFLMFGFYGVASGGGGPEDPACLLDPFPDASQCNKTTVFATITVARAKDCSCIGDPLEPNTYSVHITVRDKKKGKPKEVHLYSFSTPRGAGDLCALEETDLFEQFFRVFCSLGVQDLFGFDGIAVIKDAEIVQEENCGTPAEIIQLEVAICDVPL